MLNKNHLKKSNMDNVYSIIESKFNDLLETGKIVSEDEYDELLDGNETSEAVRVLYNEGKLTDKELEETIEDLVLEKAEEQYEKILDPKSGIEYADGLWNLLERGFLAYAMDKGIIDGDNLSFCSKDTPEEYIERYGEENLVENLKEKLLEPEDVNNRDDDHYDPHPACMHGH